MAFFQISKTSENNLAIGNWLYVCDFLRARFIQAFFKNTY